MLNRIKEIIERHAHYEPVDGYESPVYILNQAGLHSIEEQILSEMQPNNDTPPQLNKHEVISSGLHPKVCRFAADMDKELKANEHKGNWEVWKDVQQMISELEWHKAKLLIALREGDKSRVREHLADCGNILMFMGNADQLYDSDHC